MLANSLFDVTVIILVNPFSIQTSMITRKTFAIVLVVLVTVALAQTIPTDSATLTPAAETTPAPHKTDDESIDYLLVLSTLVMTIFLTYGFLRFDFKYLPESIAIIFIGTVLGGVLVFNNKTVNDVFKLDANTFSLFLLPPIIFESGYNLKKRDFFSNFGSIFTFAVFGTLISTIVVALGLGIFRLLPWVDAFVFASLISATDPVATIAVMSGVDVDVTLKTLIFGESVLNDAIAIILFKSFSLSQVFTLNSVLLSITHFVMTFFGSIAIGTLSAMFTALMFKHIDFRKYPSLEFTLLLIACYSTYLVGEGLQLSGILAILSNGIVNSHYTHFNLSHASQVSAHLMFRTLAFICETIVFAYLGLAVFSFHHEFNFLLVFFAIILCFLGRAANIFSLSWVLNRTVRSNKISEKSQFTMFWSGLRGAIAFSLSLTTSENANHNKIVTTTLFIVLFTTIVLGGGTLPLLKYLYNDVVMTGQVGTEEDIVPDEAEVQQTPITPATLSLIAHLDEMYVRPFFRVHHRSPPNSPRNARIQSYGVEVDDSSFGGESEDEKSDAGLLPQIKIEKD
jgi:sodium/hydrogen exchanger 8